jgi:hypothetical protein
MKNENTVYQELSYVQKNPEANADKPAAVTPQNENGFAFLQALHFQNPSKLQQVLVLYDGL